MAIVLDTSPQARFADVQARLIDYATRVEQLRSPDDVLDELEYCVCRGWKTHCEK
jgi:hypothetical protein